MAPLMIIPTMWLASPYKAEEVMDPAIIAEII